MASDIALRIDSRLENVSLLGTVMNAIAVRFGYDEAETANIELCVVEAVSNSVRHAYKGEPGHPVTVEVRLVDHGLEIRVLDEGLPVPPENRVPREPDFDPTDIFSVPEGGRGTFIMHSLMDSVTYGLEGRTNVLLLTKAPPARP